MKKLHIIIIAIILAALVFFLLREFVFGGKGRLNKPESVVYDNLNDRYLISNTGNGTIVAMDMEGKITPFIIEGLKSPKGMKLGDFYLYVTDLTRFHAIDLKKGTIAETFEIEGAKSLNDIEIDENGLFYITDTEANALFIFDKNKGAVEKTIKHELLTKPNGIAYDRPGYRMLIVCQKPASPILEYKIASQEVGVFMNTLYSDLDGITIIEEHGEGEQEHGAIYFTSWGQEKIYRIPPELNRIEPLDGDYPSPADLIYNSKTKELVIPLMTKNEIVMRKIL